MDIRKITKTDKQGKRLFVEISKSMKDGKNLLPDLKKGDEVLVMPRRILPESFVESLLGKYVKLFELTPDEEILCDKGVIARNKAEYWGEAEDFLRDRKYALIGDDGEAIHAFNGLNEVFDLQILPGKERFVTKVKCYKCEKDIVQGFKFCPHCGKRNKEYNRDE